MAEQTEMSNARKVTINVSAFQTGLNVDQAFALKDELDSLADKYGVKFIVNMQAETNPTTSAA